MQSAQHRQSDYNVLITGADRGIGLALVKEYQNQGANVLAVACQTSDELKQTRAEVISGIDFCCPENFKKLTNKIGDRKLQIIINNAGTANEDTLTSMDWKGLDEQWKVNALAPLKITTGLLDTLTKGSKVGFITSKMACVEDDQGGYYGYRMTKAAMNAMAKNMAQDLKKKGIHVALIDPGYVPTQMTGYKGDVSPEDSAKGIFKVLDQLDSSSSGCCFDYHGNKH